ncbi:MAG: hypothetical protein B6D39_11435 [Anaerolineae bacterium UTCFX2]|jgi:penicillin-binding protein 2|nr:penicillin-binding transpeptidase domain-containing protein [Anaerolineales bacterium]OQY88308.1 MAG: hypothetical protein B6D39_11435 [Anaerolineae bacterium UTCFX2]
MKRGYLNRPFLLLLSVLLVLSGCAPYASAGPGATLPAAAPTSPSLYSSAANIEAVKKVAVKYLDGWTRDDYSSMYPLLTELSKDAIKADEFARHYQGVAIEAALGGVEYEIRSVLVNPDTAQVRYSVTLDSVLVGDIQRETVMNLRLENGNWKIEWDDTLLLPELQGGNYLVMNRTGYVPARANIYDRIGLALVAQADATAIGLLPDEIDPASADSLFATLSELTGMPVSNIRALYESAPAGAGWYVPLGEVSAGLVSSQYSALANQPGVRLRPYKSRFYFDGGIAPHVLGYVSAIQPEEVEEYKRQGYQQDERVGRSGIEKWGEEYLAGKRGGALYVFNAQGQPVTRLAEVPAQPSQAIYSTIDRDFQVAAQRALAGFRGAIVILERDTGRVLVMVSSPGFDPNVFEPINANSAQMRFAFGSDPNQPLLNRATQGQYPPGSIFKIVTMAAGLESGQFTPETTYQCGYFFDELPGARLHDWTYDYFLQNGHTIPSGLLTLPQGLIRSCNPFFWHIGLTLYNAGLTTAISEMARGFGLGKPTGIIGLDEAAGQIPDPVNPVDAVNLAIGQGDMLATPLQVANFVAAVGNGGKLYRPQVIEKIAPLQGKEIQQFKAELIGRLPLAPEMLEVIQQAMQGVIRGEAPRGTAWHVFTGLDVPVAGKTGTAQAASGAPHAWFAGYTFAERKDKPDIAGVVLIENVGEGSDYAAPVFRRIVELYFSGQPQKLYWWESSLNTPITSTVTTEGTALPPLIVPPAP